MNEFEQYERAKRMYLMLCEALDDQKWMYFSNERAMTISCEAAEDGFPTDLNIMVLRDAGLVELVSDQLFSVKEEYRVDMAIAVGIINNALKDDCLDFSMESGRMTFRRCFRYADYDLDKAAVSELITDFLREPDYFRHGILRLANGAATIERFVEIFFEENERRPLDEERRTPDAARLESASKAYGALCETMKRKGLNVREEKEKGILLTSVKGRSVPVRFRFSVDGAMQQIRVSARLPLTVREEMRAEAAVATTAATYSLLNGWFSYDIENGTIVFRMSQPFLNSEINESLLDYMISVCVRAVNDNYDLFLELDSGKLSLARYLEMI